MTTRASVSAEVEALFADLRVEGPKVGLLLAMESHRSALEPAAEELYRRQIPFEIRTLTPSSEMRVVIDYASTAVLRGLRVLIATSSASPGLPAVLAAVTELPVIAVPVPSEGVTAAEALLLAAQTGSGAPVGCMAVGGGRNAAIFASKILAQGPYR